MVGNKSWLCLSFETSVENTLNIVFFCIEFFKSLFMFLSWGILTVKHMILKASEATVCSTVNLFRKKIKQSFFETIFFPVFWGVDWLYWTLSIDQHPSNPPFKFTVWCNSMQVNILRDFTEITVHVLQGQRTPKILGFLWPCERQFFSSNLCNLMMEIYFSFRLTWNIIQVISAFWSSSH